MLNYGKLFMEKNFCFLEIDLELTEKSFDLPNLSNGVYSAKIILENEKSVNKKVVILN